MKKETKNSIVKLLGSALAIGVLLLAVFLIFKHFGITELTREQIQEYISSTGAIAPLVFILASFLQVTFVPIPSTVTILAGCFMFGAPLAFVYSYVGIMLGALLAFALGRLIGRPYLVWVAGSKEEADSWIAKLKGRENVFLFFAFLFPLFPDDLLCSVAGMLPVKFSTFTIMQLITRTTAIGATLLFMSGEIIPYEGWGLVVIAFLIILALAAFVLSMKYAEELNRLFEGLVRKIADKIKPKKK
jgi:uncharacterized membrane protein YdjX (TVP38/TMEM64 family)